MCSQPAATRAAGPPSPDPPGPDRPGGTARTTLETRKVTKVYRSGEVEVHALRGVDLKL